MDELDATDHRLLAALQKDGRITNAELSERVNLSPSACHRRVQRLEIPDVLECHLMAGTADYLLKVVARDTEDFARIHRQHLARLPGVAQMQSSFALRRVVQTTAIPV